MKNLFRIGLLFATVLFYGNSIARAEPETMNVTLTPRNVFVPNEISSTVDTYAIVEGYFPDSCYRWAGAEVTNIAPDIQQMRVVGTVTTNEMCAMYMIPYQKPVDLGRLEPGEHTLRVLKNDGTYSEIRMNVR